MSQIVVKGRKLENVWKMVKLPATMKLFTSQAQALMTLGKKPFENILEKGENAANQNLSPFSKGFLPYQREKSSYHITSIVSHVISHYEFSCLTHV